jgi:hypothetical protein
MSSPSRHDDDRNASDVALEPQPTDRPMTNVNTADATAQMRVAETDEDATEQTRIFSDLEISPAPRMMMRKGVATKGYPIFTHQTNWKDIMLVRHLSVDRPWGGKKEWLCWDVCAEYLSMAVDPDNKNLVFPLGINGEQAKKIFFALMELIQTVHDEVPFDMGLGDAVDEVSELQVTLEDLFEEYAAFVNNTLASLM